MSEHEIDLAGLRAAAEAATPGPWVARPPHNFAESVWSEFLVYAPNRPGWPVSEVELTPGGGEHGDDGLTRENATYIAAASPDVVLALIERVEAAEVKVGYAAAALNVALHEVASDEPDRDAIRGCQVVLNEIATAESLDDLRVRLLVPSDATTADLSDSGPERGSVEVRGAAGAGEGGSL